MLKTAGCYLIKCPWLLQPQLFEGCVQASILVFLEYFWCISAVPHCEWWGLWRGVARNGQLAQEFWVALWHPEGSHTKKAWDQHAKNKSNASQWFNWDANGIKWRNCLQDLPADCTEVSGRKCSWSASIRLESLLILHETLQKWFEGNYTVEVPINPIMFCCRQYERKTVRKIAKLQYVRLSECTYNRNTTKRQK